MNKLIFFFVLTASSFGVSAMSEEQCKSQAMVVPHLLKMAEDGSLPANDEYVKKLNKAILLINNGEFCAARQIVLNLKN